MLLSGLVYIKIFTHLPKIKEKIRYIFQIQKNIQKKNIRKPWQKTWQSKV